MAFVATYKLDSSSGKWVGEVKGSRGNAINSAPFWAATVPAAAQRKIYTMHKNGRAVEFQWNALTAGLTAAEKTALNLGANGNLVANIRSLHLHDIVNSQIAHVGAPSGKFYGNSDYRSFFDAVRNRKHMVYVGANDGMLHGFEAGESKPSAYGSGDEKLAYIPKGLVSSLHLLTQSNYVHRYWVDGSPFVGEAQTGSGRPGGWSTILVGALGAGGKGYYILDVTEGDALTNVSDLVIADTTDSSDADLGHQFNAPVGSAYAGTSGMQPQIVQVNKRDSSGRGEWAVIMGNGYNSANGHPVLLVQSLEGSRTLYKIDPCNQVNTAICGATPVGNGDTNGLSAPRTVDVNGDGTVDIVYAGDMKGNVWKFDLGSDNTGDWKVAFNGHPLFMAKGPTGQPQPITAAPLVVVHPKGGYMLGVGTGRNLTQTDETDQNLNSFYGLYDTQSMSVGRSTGSSPVPVVTLGAGTPIPSANGTGNGRYSALFQQTAGGLSATADADGLRKGTSSTDSSVRVDGVNLRGWYFDLPDLQNNNASKVLLNPVAVSGGVVRFLSHNVSSVASGSGSTNPSDRYCKTVSVDGMKTQLNFFDLFNGNRPKSTLLVGLSGSLRPYTPDGTDKDNRFQFDATTHFLADGSDTLQGVGANLEATAVPPDVPGKRAGWRVSR